MIMMMIIMRWKWKWILTEVSRLRSGRLSQKKKKLPNNFVKQTPECSWRATVAPGHNVKYDEVDYDHDDSRFSLQHSGST